MADNVTLNAGSGGDVVRADDDGTAKWQYVKLAYGPDNTQTIVSDSNPLPVDDAGGSLTVDNGGTFAVQVDGDALTALQLIDNIVQSEDAVHSSGAAGVMALAVRQDSQVDFGADGDYVPLSIDANGQLRVTGSAGGTSATDDSAFTAASGSGTPIMGFASSDAVDSGDVGVVAMTTDRELKVQVSSYAESQVDDAAFTPGTDAVAMVGATFDDTTPDSVDEGDGGAIRMSSRRELYVQLRDAAGNERGLNVDTNGDIGVTGTVTANLSSTDNTVLDNIDTNTSAGASHYRNVDANAEAEIKGSAGILHWLHVMNMTAAVAYLHLYDATAANVTPGSTTPDFTFPIATTGDTNGAGFNLPLGPNGQAFANAITLVVTTTIDGSAGDPGTNGVFVNAGYT